MDVARKRIWGWFFFDWASQPYNTLLLTFIFGPYVVSVVGDGSKAQAIWGYGIGGAGLVIAVLAPLLGAVADRSGGRMAFWLHPGALQASRLPDPLGQLRSVKTLALTYMQIARTLHL